MQTICSKKWTLLSQFLFLSSFFSISWIIYATEANGVFLKSFEISLKAVAQKGQRALRLTLGATLFSFAFSLGMIEKKDGGAR